MKVCTRCKLPKDDTEFIAIKPKGRSARKHSWCHLCLSTHRREYGATWLAAHRKEKSEYDKARAIRIREEVLLAYGGECACLHCTENRHQFLSVDHVNGNGNTHRREIKTGKIYEWLKKMKFPKEGFQLLCFNCNCARGFFGYCCIPPVALISH